MAATLILTPCALSSGRRLRVSTPTPRSSRPAGPAGIRFGQVRESPDEAIGSMRYLVVSSDAYNTAFGDRRVIAVEIPDSRAAPPSTSLR